MRPSSLFLQNAIKAFSSIEFLEITQTQKSSLPMA